MSGGVLLALQPTHHRTPARLVPIAFGGLGPGGFLVDVDGPHSLPGDCLELVKHLAVLHRDECSSPLVWPARSKRSVSSDKRKRETLRVGIFRGLRLRHSTCGRLH